MRNSRSGIAYSDEKVRFKVQLRIAAGNVSLFVVYTSIEVIYLAYFSSSKLSLKILFKSPSTFCNVVATSQQVVLLYLQLLCVGRHVFDHLSQHHVLSGCRLTCLDNSVVLRHCYRLLLLQAQSARHHQRESLEVLHVPSCKIRALLQKFFPTDYLSSTIFCAFPLTFFSKLIHREKTKGAAVETLETSRCEVLACRWTCLRKLPSFALSQARTKGFWVMLEVLPVFSPRLTESNQLIAGASCKHTNFPRSNPAILFGFCSVVATGKEISTELSTFWENSPALVQFGPAGRDTRLDVFWQKGQTRILVSFYCDNLQRNEIAE